MSIENKNLRHDNNKNFVPRKTFWKIFATFNLSIVLLAAQVNRKMESDINSGAACDR